MGTMIPQENGTEFQGNGEFPKMGVLKKGEPKKRNAQPSAGLCRFVPVCTGCVFFVLCDSHSFLLRANSLLAP